MKHFVPERIASKVKSHQRQLVDSSDPTYKSDREIASSNPTNGSWWIVQILQRCRRNTGIRRDLNNPPTAVGGIQLFHC